MKKRLQQFYEAYGDRGVMFILYALSVVVNVLPAVFAELPSICPDEINVAGIAAAYAGKDWSALLKNTGSESGYIQSLFYTPLFWIFKNPFALYRAMLIVNALIIGFIPIIVYRLAGKFGVTSVRRKLLVSLCCGMYISYMINSKFIWNESLTCLLSWLLVLCVFSSWDKRGKSARAMMSVLTGFLCALAYAANKRLISPVAALILTAVIVRFVFKEKMLNLPIFGITLVGSFTAEHFLRLAVYDSLHGAANVNAGAVEVNANAASRFFGVFFSHIYAFMTSSIGMGALAAAIFAVMMLSHLAEGIKARPVVLEDGTKIYEPVKHKYNVKLTAFALFQFLAVGCTSMIPAFSAFGTGKYSAEAAVFGRYTDNIAPFAMFLVLTFVFLYGINLVKALIGALIYGYSCICFAVAGYPLAQLSNQFEYSPLLGTLQILFGDGIEEGSSGMSYIIMSSFVFTIYALLMVFISCTRKHRSAYITGTVFCVVAAAMVFGCAVYLPKIFADSSRRLAPYKEAAALIYNDVQSPPITVYETDYELAATVQFLAPDTHVSILKRGGKIPGSCLMITENGVKVPFKGGSYDIVGKTDEFTVYAYGENARDFISYRKTAKSRRPQVSNADSAIVSDSI